MWGNLVSLPIDHPAIQAPKDRPLQGSLPLSSCPPDDMNAGSIAGELDLVFTVERTEIQYLDFLNLHDVGHPYVAKSGN